MWKRKIHSIITVATDSVSLQRACSINKHSKRLCLKICDKMFNQPWSYPLLSFTAKKARDIFGTLNFLPYPTSEWKLFRTSQEWVEKKSNDLNNTRVEFCASPFECFFLLLLLTTLVYVQCCIDGKMCIKCLQNWFKLTVYESYFFLKQNSS